MQDDTWSFPEDVLRVYGYAHGPNDDTFGLEVYFSDDRPRVNLEFFRDRRSTTSGSSSPPHAKLDRNLIGRELSLLRTGLKIRSHVNMAEMARGVSTTRANNGSPDAPGSRLVDEKDDISLQIPRRKVPSERGIPFTDQNPRPSTVARKHSGAAY